MKRKFHTPEQIIKKLREADAIMAQVEQTISLVRNLFPKKEILKSGSVRGVEALLYGRILWHSSIEREEQRRIQSMPT